MYFLFIKLYHIYKVINTVSVAIPVCLLELIFGTGLYQYIVTRLLLYIHTYCLIVYTTQFCQFKIINIKYVIVVVNFSLGGPHNQTHQLISRGGTTLWPRWSQDHLDLEKKKFIHNNLKFYIYLPLKKKIGNTSNFFLCQKN